MQAAVEKGTSLTGFPFVHVILTGNPNCGKTTLFNALTGLRAKVGNYAGVTVERKEGRMLGSTKDRPITILDLPGTYSLSPQSLDEQISRDVLFHRLADVPPPSVVVVVVDASNLERNLYYATQVIELGYPTVVALNMIDVAVQNGHEIDVVELRAALGVPVFPLIASENVGVTELQDYLRTHDTCPTSPAVRGFFCDLSPEFKREVDQVADLLRQGRSENSTLPAAEALLLLSDDRVLKNSVYTSEIEQAITQARTRLEQAGQDWRSVAIESRYARISTICARAIHEKFSYQETLSDKLDKVLTHRLWGMLVFVGIMGLMFQSIFTFARLPMDAIQAGVDWGGNLLARAIPPGDLNSLLVKGVIGGVGSVLVFLPQILLLFLFIGLLEDTGYMARAAFLMDRLMSKVGLHGKSFIPMLSSFACAIPGIMATRTIESPKDRLVTILVAPLMSCSARLPVYTLLIAACVPDVRFLGFLRLQGATMLAMYLLGLTVALFMAWLFKKTLLRSETPLLVMELPPYKKPLARVVLRHMWDRSKIFLRRAGTVILGISILLWFLATYPKSRTVESEFAAKRQAVEAAGGPERAGELERLEHQEMGERLRRSFAGRIGQALEPVIAPLGFDWKIGIGLVASFAAREVFVSTMSTVYNVGEVDKSDEGTKSLAQTLQLQKRPDGSRLYTPLLGVTLMVFYVFALQCISTVAIVRRETNAWKWAAFQWAYMGILAWVFAFITFHGGRLAGWE